MNALTEIRREANSMGYKNGYTQGEEDGFEYGFDEGFDLGKQLAYWMFRGTVIGFILGVGIIAFFSFLF